MGYTHNWYRPQVISQSTFNAITEDFQKIVPALEAAGSPIANAYGLQESEFTAETIRFNGVRHCGHTPNPEVRLPWPGNGASGIGDNTGILTGTLPFRTCNGDCSYESVWFDRCEDDDGRDENGICVAGSAKQPSVPMTLQSPSFYSSQNAISAGRFAWRQMEKPRSGRCSTAVSGGTRLQPDLRGGDCMNMTNRIAHAIGTDAANRQMRQDGRTAWNEDDYHLASETLRRDTHCVHRCLIQLLYKKPSIMLTTLVATSKSLSD